MGAADSPGSLLAVPSFHFAPVFAGQVRRAIRDLAPTAIAVEAPPEALDDLDWAAGCWPTPVCVVLGDVVFPFVPGDSILEAHRLGRLIGIPVHPVDVFVRRRRDRARGLPDPALAARMGAPFQSAVEAITARPPHQRADAAREAAMARALQQLVHAGRRVLWVGGMAHWRPIEARIAAGDFRAPGAVRRAWSDVERLVLAPDALVRLTGTYPWLVRRYAADPDAYDQDEAIRDLALTALEETDVNEGLILVGHGLSEGEEWPEEPAAPADVARTLVYARNLAATARVGQMPTLHELVTAAAATIGRRYAGRLLALALEEEPPTTNAADLPRLAVAETAGDHGYRVGQDVRTLVPAWGEAARRTHPRSVLALRRTPASPFQGLPGYSGREECYWLCHPDDERAYEAFVPYVLRRASMAQGDDGPSAPFLCGLGGGIDVRETLRHRHEGRVFVREERAMPVPVTNGVIDWEHGSESDDRLQRRVRHDWIDPSLQNVGSVSREGPPYEEIHQDPTVRLVHRDFSMLSLDAPTWIPQDDTRSLYGRVIIRLMSIPATESCLYSWLDVFFGFCAGKTVAYYSRYAPGPRIHRVARDHRVRILHVPLHSIPAPLLERNRRFRFAALNAEQRAEVMRRGAAAGSAWPARRAARHG